MAILTWILTALLVLCVALIFHFRRFRGYLEHCGLPLVKPFLCFGSSPFLLNKIYMHKWYQEKFQALGYTFARYDGVTPQIVSMDPEFIKEVTVKQFENFSDTFQWDVEPGQTTLDLARGDTWRPLRKLLSPTFTSGKLKSMMHPIEGLADDTIEGLSDAIKNNPEIDLKNIINGFALDSISKVAFGLDTNVRRGQDMEFYNIAKDVFDAFKTDTWGNVFFFNIIALFPEIVPKLGIWPESAVKIRNMTQKIMAERDEKNINVGDFVDRLREFKKTAALPITSDMIDAQGMVFLTAGFETTANTMGSMIYHIACYPEVQETIFNEIIDNIGSDDITHDNISKLDYLEAVITETLRVCPPIIEHDRVCTNDCEVQGIKIKKGVKISMPNYSAHYNPEFFPQPEVFNPDRFLKENAENIIPYTWRPFGSGNRVCIGQRFALMEIKIFISKLLYKFKIERTPRTELKYSPGGFFLISYPEIVVALKPRF